MSGAARRAFVAIGAMAIGLAMALQPVQAQKLDLAFHDGAVSLVAEDVTVRQVLDEWARLGGTRVVNAHLLGGARISLQLDRVPEAQAIDRLLESAAGYVARRRSGTTGPSDFALILVLATSDPTTAATDTLRASHEAEPAVEAPPAATVPENTPTPAADPDADPDSEISSNEANGRATGTRPLQGRLASEAPAIPVPADQLPAGRPEGARPGIPGAVLPAGPGAPMPSQAAPAAADPTQDANGRQRPRP